MVIILDILGMLGPEDDLTPMMIQYYDAFNLLYLICFIIFILVIAYHVFEFLLKFKEKENMKQTKDSIYRYLLIFSITFLILFSILSTNSAVHSLDFSLKFSAIFISIFTYFVTFIGLDNIFKKYYFDKNIITVLTDSVFWMINFVLFTISLSLFILLLWQYFVNPFESPNLESTYLLLAAIMTFLFLIVTTISVFTSKQSIKYTEKREKKDDLKAEIEELKKKYDIYTEIESKIKSLRNYIEEANKSLFRVELDIHAETGVYNEEIFLVTDKLEFHKSIILKECESLQNFETKNQHSQLYRFEDNQRIQTYEYVKSFGNALENGQNPRYLLSQIKTVRDRNSNDQTNVEQMIYEISSRIKTLEDELNVLRTDASDK